MAYLIDTALSNIQKGKIKFKDSDLTLMEKLVDEFQEELFASGLKIIELNKNRVILDDLRTTVGIDMELNFHSGIKFYGEFMADDFILTPKNNPYPNRTGFLAGIYFADPLGTGNTDFRLEYTHINNYVYFSPHLWQDYLYQGEYIGSPLGPDADQLYLELTQRLSDKLNLSLSYTHERHGEGQAGIPLPSDPIIANENIYLSGIIEKHQTYQAEIFYDLSPRWALSVSASLENIKNIDNTVGENESNTYFQLELNYQF